MVFSRRQLLKATCVLGASTVIGNSSQANESQATNGQLGYACLVDLTVCIGCRKCEKACAEENKLPKPDTPYEDLTVFQENRPLDISSFTVINRFYPGRIDRQTGQPIPVFVKKQCMHCLDPVCVSACPVGAMTKKSNGAVHYNEDLCIGCRYCMIACPFEVPAYEYHLAMDPRVRKCTLCYSRLLKDGGTPACAAACPVEAITFGPRCQMCALAKEKIASQPARYVNHIYGEQEAGGTSWLYIAADPFAKMGFPTLDTYSPAALTRMIQTSLYENLQVPLLVSGAFLAMAGIIQGVKKTKKKPENEGEE